jgi:hypothetical protein
MEELKNIQLGEIKTQYQADLQGIKRQNASALDLYEE